MTKYSRAQMTGEHDLGMIGRVATVGGLIVIVAAVRAIMDMLFIRMLELLGIRRTKASVSL